MFFFYFACFLVQDKCDHLGRWVRVGNKIEYIMFVLNNSMCTRQYDRVYRVHKIPHILCNILAAVYELVSIPVSVMTSVCELFQYRCDEVHV